MLFQFNSIVSGIPIYGFHIVCIISTLPLFAQQCIFPWYSSFDHGICVPNSGSAQLVVAVYVYDLIINSTIEMNQGVEGITVLICEPSKFSFKDFYACLLLTKY